MKSQTPKYLKLNIENASLLREIETKKESGTYIVEKNCFHNQKTLIPQHLLLNMLTYLIGEVPIPKYKEYGNTNELKNEKDEQKGRMLLKKIVIDSPAYAKYYINNIDLFSYWNEESYVLPYVAVSKKDKKIHVRGKSKEEVKNLLIKENKNEKDYTIFETYPWDNAPWEYMNGKKTAVNSNTGATQLLFKDGDFEFRVDGEYTWYRFNQAFQGYKEASDTIIKFIEKVLESKNGLTKEYKSFQAVCEALYFKLYETGENNVRIKNIVLENEIIDFCKSFIKNWDGKNGKLGKIQKITCYLYALFGYHKKSEELYSKKLPTSNIAQDDKKNDKINLNVNRVIYTNSQLQKLKFNGDIIIKLEGKLNEDEINYLMEGFMSNSGITNCLEGWATIEFLDVIDFSMNNYHEIIE